MKRTTKDFPEVSQLRAELKRENYKKRYKTVLRSTVFSLLVVAALAILVAVLWMPVLRIYGTSMTPTLSEGEIVVSLKGDHIRRGDVVGVYYGSKLLIKRCIGVSGEWINIDEDGTVYINNERLDEPYLVEKALGDCNIKLPYQVAEDAVFVMGDHRSTSVDSRNAAVGCIANENVIGKIVFRIWPLDKFGVVR